MPFLRKSLNQSVVSVYSFCQFVSAFSYLYYSQRQNVSNLCFPPERDCEQFRVLFGQLCVIPDLCHDQSNDPPVKDAGDGKELLVCGDVVVPGVRVLDGEPLLAEAFDLGEVNGALKVECLWPS